jgi:SAM-dependent methyltransferase
MSSIEPALPATGERYTPELDGHIRLEHWHRYLLAGDLAAGKRVLDIACGEGYGSDHLARVAASVVGVDIDAAAVGHAARRYRRPGLEFRQGSCTAIPLEDHSIDLAVSFETLEHHGEHAAMLLELRRVLKPGGLLLISCPEKLHYSDHPGYDNRFHVKELYLEDFEALLKSHFGQVSLYGQRSLEASLLLPYAGAAGPWRDRRLAAGGGRDLERVERPTIVVALASDGDLPRLGAGLLVDMDAPSGQGSPDIERMRWREETRLRAQLEEAQRHNAGLQARIGAMAATRAWRLALAWWSLKEKLAAWLAPGPAPLAIPESGASLEAPQASETWAPLAALVEDTEAIRVNVMMPGLEIEHLFGGYLGILQLAARLAKDGHRVRLLLYLPGHGPDLESLDAELARCGLKGLLDSVEVLAVGDRRHPFRVNPRDHFVAFSHQGALLSSGVCRELDEKRLLYFVQEYEPLFFSASSGQARALEALALPQVRLYSTETLKAYVEEQVPSPPHTHSPVVLNAVGGAPPSKAALLSRRRRRLLFYARMQPHAGRNLVELGLEALRGTIENGGLDPGAWEFWGIGNEKALPDVALARGARLRLIPRLSLERYYAMLGQFDLGLSLMLSPHPSLPPLDMAAAGLVVVTNTFATKTAESLRGVSGNLLGVEATRDALEAGLREAERRCDDVEARLRSAAIHWPRDWDASLAPAMPWIQSFLAEPAGSSR